MEGVLIYMECELVYLIHIKIEQRDVIKSLIANWFFFQGNLQIINMLLVFKDIPN